MSERLKKETHRLESKSGERLEDRIQEMTNYAKDHGQDVVTNFSGLEMTVVHDLGFSSTEWLAHFKILLALRAKEFRDELDARDEVELPRLQIKLDEVVNRLDSLDFEELESVIDWVIEFIESSDRVGLTFDNGKILDVLRRNNFSMTTGDVDNDIEEHPDKFAQHIVANVMDYMHAGHGFVHPGVKLDAERWKDKFGQQ